MIYDEESSHYYTASGEPRYDANLRTARKEGLLPSVTTVFKIVNKEGLNLWKINNAIESAIKLKKNDNETDAQFIQRVFQDSKEKSLTATNFGTAIHNNIENFNKTGKEDFHPDLKPFCAHWVDYYNKNIKKVIEVEVGLGDKEYGVGGKVDLIAKHNIDLAIIDYKTQACKYKNGKKVVNFRENFIWQLALYAEMYKRYKKLKVAPRCISIIIDSNEPSPVYEKIYTPQEQADGLETALLIVKLWQKLNNYYPQTSDNQQDAGLEDF